MMNYKIVNKPGEWAEIPGTDGKYVTTLVDILETKTNQVIVKDVPSHPGRAKAICRHLNMGGGFDGFTPAFFLERLILTNE